MNFESLYIILQCMFCFIALLLCVAFVCFIMFYKQKHLYDNELSIEEKNKVKHYKDKYYKGFITSLKLAGIMLFIIIIIWFCLMGIQIWNNIGDKMVIIA